MTADLGRLVRSVPRAALSLPRGIGGRRIGVAALAALVLVAAYFLWFRDSSLVAVTEVEISGVSVANDDVEAALTAAAEEMTTLNADAGELERAVAEFPTVASISIDPGFPRRLAIEVVERAPVGSIGAGEGIAVAGDGTILGSLGEQAERLPPIEVAKTPSSGRLDGVALAQAEVLGTAPDPLRPAIRGAQVNGEHGVVVALVEGIELRFGDSSEAEAKWAAAAAILADPKLDELDYIDLRLPGRPAVGGAPLPASASPEAETVDPALPVAPVPADPAAIADLAADPAATAPAPEPTTAAPAATEATAPATGVAGGAAAP